MRKYMQSTSHVELKIHIYRHIVNLTQNKKNFERISNIYFLFYMYSYTYYICIFLFIYASYIYIYLVYLCDLLKFKKLFISKQTQSFKVITCWGQVLEVTKNIQKKV